MNHDELIRRIRVMDVHAGMDFLMEELRKKLDDMQKKDRLNVKAVQ